MDDAKQIADAMDWLLANLSMAVVILTGLIGFGLYRMFRSLRRRYRKSNAQD